MSTTTRPLFFFRHRRTGELVSANNSADAHQYLTDPAYKEISRTEHQVRTERNRLLARLEELDTQIENGTYYITD